MKTRLLSRDRGGGCSGLFLSGLDPYGISRSGAISTAGPIRGRHAIRCSMGRAHSSGRLSGRVSSRWDNVRRAHLVTQLHSRESLGAWDKLFRNFDIRTQHIKILKAKLYPAEGKARAAQMITYRIAAPGSHNLYGRSIQLNYSPLRPGVIVEFEEQYDDYKPGEFWPALWGHYFLQTGAPCRYRRHTVAVASPFTLSYCTHNRAPAPQERHHKDYHVCTWEVNDMPGVEFDEWTPPLRDFAPGST